MGPTVLGFVIGLGCYLVAAHSNGAGICNADLSLVANHPGLNPSYNGVAPICEIPNERDLSVTQGGQIPIHIYQDAQGSRLILGWLVYVTDSQLNRQGFFSSWSPYENGNGTLGNGCADGSVITHSTAVGTTDLTATWNMPANAAAGEYSIQALVLTSDPDGVSNWEFFIPRCPSVCLITTNPRCQTVNKASLQLAQGYLEIYAQSNVITCTSTDVTSPCPSGVCDLSVDPARVNGLCEAVYVSHDWLEALPGGQCDINGYTFSVPRAGSGFEVTIPSATCGGSPVFSATVPPSVMQLTNADGSTFIRALPQHNCLTLGCQLNDWKCVHRGYYDNENSVSVQKFDLDANLNQHYFCMIPGPSLGECYCDDACTRLKDCCADFADTCQTSLGANVSP